jgi:hypothetical protein
VTDDIVFRVKQESPEAKVVVGQEFSTKCLESSRALRKFCIEGIVQIYKGEELMDMQMVRDLLSKAANSRSMGQPDESIPNIALALLQIAEGVDEIRKAIARLPIAPRGLAIS